MFTGIIEETGILVSSARGPRSCVLNIRARAVLDGTGPGDSIAVNGVCLTAATVSPTGFTADVMPETLARTGLGSMKPGALVNLERAMAADGRFGGHIVSGHIDGTGTISMVKRDGNAIWYLVVASLKSLIFKDFFLFLCMQVYADVLCKCFKIFSSSFLCCGYIF